MARKKSTLPVSYGNFPGVVADPSGTRGLNRKDEGTSGCGVTSPSGVTGRCGGNAIRNAGNRPATTSTSAKGEPTQMRGPASNGM